jgi:pSer/pThr/pTyr-binding forkhead associated (FHA) protein
MEGEKVAALHCLLSWLPDGLHVIDLDSDQGTVVDGKRIRERLVRDGQGITVGGKRFIVRLKGDPTAPAAARLEQAKNTPPAIALSAIFGPHAGETVLLPEDQPLVLGSGEDADLRLARDALLGPRHLELKLEPLAAGELPPTVQVRDLDKRGDVLVNRQPLTGPGAVTVGDVIQFGTPQKVAPTTLLVHYDLALEAW